MSGAVIIRRCATAEEAVIVCALLENAGIPTSIDSWHHAMIDWGVVQALGGVAVRVPASLFNVARQTIIDYADSAEDRLSSEFPLLDPYPLPQNRLRYYILMIFFTGFFLPPLLLLTDLVAVGVRVIADARLHGLDWPTIAAHLGGIRWMETSLMPLFGIAYFLVPLSIFVFLARRFLNQRARQKHPA